MNAPSRHAPCYRPRLIHMGDSDRFGAFLPSDADVPTHLGVGRRVSDQRLQRAAESQRALVAAKLANMPQGARTDIASIEAMSQSDAADLLNVSRSAVQRARSVIDEGAPPLIAAVERGQVSVSAAAEV